jgi:hypothetical protein
MAAHNRHNVYLACFSDNASAATGRCQALHTPAAGRAMLAEVSWQGRVKQMCCDITEETLPRCWTFSAGQGLALASKPLYSKKIATLF